jgi:hypothetical protein
MAGAQEFRSLGQVFALMMTCYCLNDAPYPVAMGRHVFGGSAQVRHTIRHFGSASLLCDGQRYP